MYFSELNEIKYSIPSSVDKQIRKDTINVSFLPLGTRLYTGGGPQGEGERQIHTSYYIHVIQ